MSHLLADMAMTRISFASKSNIKNNLADREHVQIVREGRFHLIICAEEEMKGRVHSNFSHQRS